MKVTVTTVMWGDAWQRYGMKFARGFDRFWPHDTNLIIVSDRELPEVKRGLVLRTSGVRGYEEFLARHEGNAQAHGKLNGTYSWRHDAVKWMPQGVAPAFASRFIADGEIMVWLDADVETFATVPVDLMPSLIGGADLSYLGREPKHSELGYWSVRLGPDTRRFVEDFADEYLSDRVFDLRQWHSAFVFDTCRRRAEGNGAISRSLTPGGRGHVWFTTPLGTCMDHMKGARKDVGRSAERPA